jgi:hypothetical protein
VQGDDEPIRVAYVRTEVNKIMTRFAPLDIPRGFAVDHGSAKILESVVYVIIASVKSSEIHPLTLKRANNAIVRSTMSFAREMMIDLRLKRPNQCL